MDLTTLPELLDRYGIPLVAIGLLSGTVVWLGRLLIRVMEARIARERELVDDLTPQLERLAEAQEETNAITKALLSDRRER